MGVDYSLPYQVINTVLRSFVNSLCTKVKAIAELFAVLAHYLLKSVRNASTAVETIFQVLKSDSFIVELLR